MATISFKGKIETAHYISGEIAYKFISVPVLARRHCDMNAFRAHTKFGDYANSDLFPAMLARIRRDIGDKLRLDNLPPNVKIDASGFLTLVTIEV